MNIFRYAYAIGALAAVGTAASLIHPWSKVQAAPGAAPVFVTNTTADPVPTIAQGTTIVAGTVALSNAVVPVRDVDVASRTPVSLSGSVTFDSNQVENVGGIFYTVPTGKRLVVQSLIATSFQLPAGQRMADMSLAPLNENAHALPLTYNGADSDSYEHYVGAFAGTMYLKAGMRLRLYAQRNMTGGQCAASILLEGYLENAS
jgi:hypothetical protein